MKNEATKQNTLDEQVISKAAAAALHDLELDIEVKSVEADGDKWCVQFTTEYRQVCDTFRDQFGKENSFELIREKIKRSILNQQQKKIRSGVRIRRGKREERRPASESFLQTALKAIEGAVGQTTEVAGEIIEQASRLPAQALTTLADTADSISPASGTTLQSDEGVEQPLARVRVKVAAKSTTQRKPAARKASSKKGSAAKATKKAAKKSKRAAAKSGSRSGKKKASTKSSKKRK